MDGGIYILLNQTLRQKNGILVVVAFPGHEADQRVFAQTDLTVAGGRTICDNLASFDMVILVYNRFLIVAVGLVTSLEFCQMVYIAVSIGISLDDDLVGSGALNHTGILCNDTHTGVNSCLRGNTGIDNGSLGGQKRYRLTLHVRSHQSTVRIVVLQERNHGSSYGEYHLRGYVHQVDFLLLELGGFLTETTRYVIVDEVSFFV